MTAINWIRSKAAPVPAMSDSLDVEGQTYRVDYVTFRGAVPFRMRRELARAPLTNGPLEREVLRILTTGTGHETGEVCYSRAVYSLVQEG